MSLTVANLAVECDPRRVVAFSAAMELEADPGGSESCMAVAHA